MNRRCEFRGFTLVEVLIGAAILAIAALSLAALLAHGPGLAQTPREETVARNAIRSMLAELAAARFDTVARDYHRAGFRCAPLRALPDDPDGAPGEIHFDYGPGGNRAVYTVTLRVRWSSRLGPREVESVAYLANIRGDTGLPVPLEELAEPGDPVVLGMPGERDLEGAQ